MADATTKTPTTPTLADLFESIELLDTNGQLTRFANLGRLLSCNREMSDLTKDLQTTRDATKMPWSQYCAAGTFQVPTRRLVDLWTQLVQLKDELGVDLEPSIPRPHPARRAQLVHDMMRQHWERTVDADPLLPPDARRRLREEGPRAGVVVPSVDPVYDHDLKIEGGSIPIAEDSPRPSRVYDARLSLAALRPGTGVPEMQLPGQRRTRDESVSGTSAVDHSGAADPIQYVPTRCAKVLYYDINELFAAETRSANYWPELTSIRPIVTTWRGPEGQVAEYAWPLPPLPTFVDMASFLRKWSEYCSSSQVWGTSDSSRDGSTIPVNTVVQMVRRWTVLGLKAVEASLPRRLQSWEPALSPLNDAATWKQITDRTFELRKRAKSINDVRSWTQIDKWLRRTARLVQPELCSPAVSQLLITEIEGLETADQLRHLNEETIGIQQNQRLERLAPLWNDGTRDLWRALNQNLYGTSVKSKWLFVEVPEPVSVETPDVLTRISEVETRLSEEVETKLSEVEARLEQKINQMAVAQDKGFKRAEFQSLLQQGKLAENEDPAAASRLYRQAVETARQMVSANPQDNQPKRDLSLSLFRLGDVERLHERWEAAEQAVKESLEIRRRLAESDPTNNEAQRDLSLALDRVGDVEVRRERWAAAEQVYGESLEIDRRLAAADPKNNQAQRELSVALGRVGDVHRRRERWEAAEQAVKESLEIRRRLAESDPTSNEAQRDLSLALDRVGDIDVRHERWDAAEQVFKESLEIDRRLTTADPTNKEAQRDLSISLEQVGNVHVRRERWDAAEQVYGESLEIRRRLAVADPKNKEAQSDLSLSLERVGNVHVRRERWGAAEQVFGESLEIRRRLAAADPTNKEAQRDLSISLERVGNVHVRRERWDAAEQVYGESLEIRRRLAVADLYNKEAQRDLSFSLERVGNVHVRRERWEAAEQVYGESLEIDRWLAAADPTNNEAQRDLSHALSRVGDVHIRRERWDAAEQVFGESLEIRRRLAAADPTNNEAQRDLSFALNRVGDVHVRRERWDAAEQVFGESLEIRRGLAATDPTNNDAQRDLSLALSRMGNVHLHRKRWGAAEQVYGESLKIDRRQAAADPTDSEAQRNLSVSLCKIGDVCLAREQWNAAEGAFRHALEITQQLVNADPTNNQLQRDLAEYLSKIAAVIRNPARAKHLRKQAYEILSSQDPIAIRYDLDLAPIYEDLKAQFEPVAKVEGTVPASPAATRSRATAKSKPKSPKSTAPKPRKKT